VAKFKVVPRIQNSTPNIFRTQVTIGCWLVSTTEASVELNNNPLPLRGRSLLRSLRARPTAREGLGPNTYRLSGLSPDWIHFPQELLHHSHSTIQPQGKYPTQCSHPDRFLSGQKQRLSRSPATCTFSPRIADTTHRSPDQRPVPCLCPRRNRPIAPHLPRLRYRPKNKRNSFHSSTNQTHPHKTKATTKVIPTSEI